MVGPAGTSKRWFAALVAATAIVVGLAVSPSTSPRVTAQESGSKIAELYAERVGVSIDEAQRRLSIQSEVQVLRGELGERFPGAFAGLQIVHEPDFELRLRWATAEVPTELFGDLDIEVIRVDRSLRELDVLARERRADGEAVSVDVESNDVVDGDEGRRYEFEMYDGLGIGGIEYGNGSYVCTAGFTLRTTATGRLGFGTAGHCPSSGSVYTLGSPGFVVPAAGPGWYGGRYDFRALDVSPSQGVAYTNEVVANDNGEFLPITSAGEAGLGDWVCQFGQTVGCGWVELTSYSFTHTDSNVQMRDFVVVVGCEPIAEPGDSGAAVVTGSFGGEIVGVLSGGGDQYEPSCDSNRMHTMVYGKIGALSDIGYAPLTFSPPRCGNRFVTHVGTNGDDVLVGTPGVDVMHGRGGNDEIRGLGGNDIICGGPGADRIYGGAGADTIYG